MNTAEAYYIYQQLEPNDIIVTGRSKKSESSWAAANRLAHEHRAKFTQEEWDKEQQEWREYLKRNRDL